MMDVEWQAFLDENLEIGLSYDEVLGAKCVRLVLNYILVDSPEAAPSITMEPDFNPSEIIILDDNTHAFLPSGSHEGEAELKHNFEPDTVLVNIDTTGESWLLLSDVWYPDWQAWIDTAETTIYRAVWVPPDEQYVEFHFHPTLGINGGGCSVVTWLFMLWMGWQCQLD